MSEAKLQMAVIKYIDEHHPWMLYCSNKDAGNLNRRVGAMIRQMGYISGAPDLAIFEPVDGYHGLFIELKLPKAVASDDQHRFHTALRLRDYMVVVCQGYRAALTTIDDWAAKCFLEDPRRTGRLGSKWLKEEVKKKKKNTNLAKKPARGGKIKPPLAFNKTRSNRKWQTN